nr:hypothetical protein [Crocosphaera chwakensis]
MSSFRNLLCISLYYFFDFIKLWRCLMGLTDTFLAPTRNGQQDRLNNYGQVVSAGLVSYSQKLGR